MMVKNSKELSLVKSGIREIWWEKGGLTVQLVSFSPLSSVDSLEILNAGKFFALPPLPDPVSDVLGTVERV